MGRNHELLVEHEQDADDGIVIRVTDVPRDLFNEVEQALYELVRDTRCPMSAYSHHRSRLRTKVVIGNLLDPCHFVEELHKQSMQANLILQTGSRDQVY